MFRFESKTKPKSSKTSIIISLILVSFLIVSGFIWAAKKLNDPQKISFKKSNDLNSTNNQPEIDSDNDGLFDWQEQLFGTDKHNPDTDNDGTKDGDEIKQNRDPLKPGPSDKLPSSDIKNQMFSQNPQIPQLQFSTLTDKFTAALMKQIIEQIPDNTSPDQINLDFVKNQLNNFLSQDYAAGNLFQDFLKISQNDLNNILTTEKDFNYYPIQSINNPTLYLNTLDKILLKYFSFFLNENKDITKIINEAFEKNNFEKTKKIAQAFLDSAQEFKQIKPVDELIPIHKNLITSMLTLAKLFNLISTPESDPLATIMAIKILPKTIEYYINETNNLINEINGTIK